jgi:hypothetical protein
MRALLVVITLLILFPAAAGAQGLIGLHSTSDPNSSPQIIAPPYVVFTYTIFLYAPEPVSHVQFRVVRTGDLYSNTVFTGFDDHGYTVQGTIEDGIVVDFGGCVSGEVFVGTVSYIATADIECGEFQIQGPYGQPDVEAALCAGGTMFPAPQPGYYSSQPPHFFNRYPANGAVDVPADVTLSWDEYFCYFFGDCFGSQCRALNFGTDPGNLTTFYGIGTSVTPGPLDPYTTYYWSILTNELGSSALWSFTTGEGPVATEESSWGRIKSLYVQ